LQFSIFPAGSSCFHPFKKNNANIKVPILKDKSIMSNYEEI
jgi:hypothetical protein